MLWAPPAATAVPPSSLPTFGERIDLGLRQLYVAVTDRGGDLVRGLERDAFRVVDDGVDQELVSFRAGDVAFSAVIAVDASRSMAGERLDAARRGVEAFTAGMAADDLARLVVFADRLRAASAWSSDPVTVADPLDAATGVGGSAVVDHLFLTLRLVHERAGRPVVVLLSDGWDMHSALSIDDLESEVRRGGVQIYWLRDAADLPGPGGTLRGDGPLPGPSARVLEDLHRARGTRRRIERAVPRSIWRGQAAARRDYERLADLVEASGGRAIAYRSNDGLERAFSELLEELRAHYALGYYPTDGPAVGAWRSLRVEVDGGRARTRSGYVEGPR